MKKKISLIFLLFFNLLIFSQEKIITSTEAKDFIGQVVYLKAKVISQKLSSETNKMNYLNLDKAYPNQLLTVVITEDYKQKKQFNLESLKGKEVKFLGKISWFTSKNGEKILQMFNPEKIEIN